MAEPRHTEQKEERDGGGRRGGATAYGTLNYVGMERETETTKGRAATMSQLTRPIKKIDGGQGDDK